MSEPLVSIVSVNYNEPEETKEFLDSLYKSSYSQFETFIVDNGSANKVSKSLEEEYENLECIIHDENLGFAGGNNLGVNKSSGKYVIFLNNDTLVPEGFISIIVDFMENNPDVGIASPKIIYPDGKIQYAGSSELQPRTGRGKRYGQYEVDSGQYDFTSETGLIHGAAMCVSREAIEKSGMMYEDYFLYYEELDWCYKIKKDGFKSSYIGTTHIIHKESVSVGIDSPLKVYYMNRNRLLFQMRNFSGIQKWMSVLFYLVFALPKWSLVFVSKGKYHHLKNLWRGVLWHVNKKYVFKNYK